MSNTITLPHQLRSLAGNRDHLKIVTGMKLADDETRTLGSILDAADLEAPGIKDRLLDTEGKLRRFVNIYVDGEDSRILADKQDKLERKAGDHTDPIPGTINNPLDIKLTGYEEIAILPAMAGG